MEPIFHPEKDNVFSYHHTITVVDMKNFMQNNGIRLDVEPGDIAKLQVAAKTFVFLTGTEEEEMTPVMGAATAVVEKNAIVIKVKPQHMNHVGVGKRVLIRSSMI